MTDRTQTLHPTIVVGVSRAPVVFEGNTFKCVICLKNGEEAHILSHVQTHERAAVRHGGYKVFRCLCGCVTSPHHHCCYCGRTVTRRDLFIQHLNTCNVTLASSVPDAICTRGASPASSAYSVSEGPPVLASSVSGSPPALVSSVSGSPPTIKVTVHTLAETFDLPLQEALVRFRRGPKYEPCEMKMIEEEMVRHLPEEAAVKLEAYKEKLRKALSSEAFLSRL